MPAKVSRKLLRVGDSKAIALPPDWLRALKIDVSDTVDVLYDFIVLIKPKGMKLDPDFLIKELRIISELEEKNEATVDRKKR